MAAAEPGNVDDEKVRIVVISDTHSSHRLLQLPRGDILIHCGDFTFYGNRESVVKKGRPIPTPGKEPHEWERGRDQIQGGADDFNAWLGEPEQQAFRHRIVVLGNHEKNQDWTDHAAEVVSNATLLRDEMASLDIDGLKVNIWGTDFWWPGEAGTADAYRILRKLIIQGQETHILVTHGPAAGYVDGGDGCSLLAEAVLSERLPVVTAVLCGHVHHAHGIDVAHVGESVVTFVNAANAGAKADLAHKPIVLELTRAHDGGRFLARVLDEELW